MTTTITRQDFMAAIEHGIDRATTLPDGLTHEQVEKLREHGRTAEKTVTGDFQAADGTQCPAQAAGLCVWYGHISDTAWNFIYAFDEMMPMVPSWTTITIED